MGHVMFNKLITYHIKEIKSNQLWQEGGIKALGQQITDVIWTQRPCAVRPDSSPFPRPSAPPLPPHFGCYPPCPCPPHTHTHARAVIYTHAPQLPEILGPECTCSLSPTRGRCFCYPPCLSFWPTTNTQQKSKMQKSNSGLSLVPSGGLWRAVGG